MAKADNVKDTFSQSHATQLLLKLFESSKESVEELVDILPVVYGVVNTDGEIVRGNRDLGKMMAIPYEKLIGKSISSLFTSENWSIIENSIKHSQKTGGQKDVLVPSHWGGREHYYQWNFVPLNRLDADPLITIIGQDITEAELSLRRVKKLNELFDRLIQTSQLMIEKNTVADSLAVALDVLMASFAEPVLERVQMSFSLSNRQQPAVGCAEKRNGKAHVHMTSNSQPMSDGTEIPIEWKGKKVGLIHLSLPSVSDKELIKFIQLLGQSTYLTLSHLSFQNEMEEKVIEGSRQIAELNLGMSSLLNSLNDGYAVIDLDGNFLSITSRQMKNFCGGDPNGKNICEVFDLPDEPSRLFREWLKLVKREALPFENMANFCPITWFTPAERNMQISLTYHAVRDVSGKIEKIAIVAVDRTEQLAAEKLAAQEREKSFLVLRILEDLTGFDECWAEFSGFINCFETEIQDLDHCKRLVHTFKSSFAFFGWEYMSQTLNEFESELTKDAKVDYAKWKRSFLNLLGEFKEEYPQIFSCLKMNHLQTHDLSDDKQFFETINSTDNVTDLRQRLVEKFLFQPIERLLDPIFVRFYARAEDCKIKVQINSEGLNTRIYANPYKNFFSVLVHLFNNIIDHAFSNIAASNTIGQVKVTVHATVMGLFIDIADNGSGIDVQKLLRRAEKNNLTLSQEQLKQPLLLIFTQDISTREEANHRAGRGIGMGVVFNEINKLGGKIEVQSTLGQGTSFKIFLPKILPTIKK